MYYETVFEDGSHSIACYESDEEALSAAEAHHKRAEAGESSLAGTDVPAVRIKAMFAYENPPGDLLSAQTLPKEQLEAELENLIENSTNEGVVDLSVLAARIRDLSNPFVESGPHESNYKAEEDKELSLPWQ